MCFSYQLLESHRSLERHFETAWKELLLRDRSLLFEECRSTLDILMVTMNSPMVWAVKNLLGVDDGRIGAIADLAH